MFSAQMCAAAVVLRCDPERLGGYAEMEIWKIVGAVAAFAFALRCVRAWAGTVRGAIFPAKSREKPRISVKTGIFGGNQAEWGRKCAAMGGGAENRKSWAHLPLCVQACVTG